MTATKKTATVVKNPAAKTPTKATIKALEKTAESAIKAHNEAAKGTIQATLDAGNALTALTAAMTDADNVGGFRGWCERHGMPRSTAYRAMDFARLWAKAEAATVKTLAGATTVNDAFEIMREANAGSGGPTPTPPITDPLAKAQKAIHVFADDVKAVTLNGEQAKELLRLLLLGQRELKTLAERLAA